MNSTQPRLDERTKYEAEMDAKYGWRFNEMNACLYRCFDFVFGFVGLFGGSGALIAALGEYKTLGVVAGAIVAAVAVLERLTRPIETAIAHDMLKERYAELLTRTPTLSLVDIDRELLLLQAMRPTGLSALRLPAYNATVRSNGRSDFVEPENAWQKVVAFFA